MSLEIPKRSLLSQLKRVNATSGLARVIQASPLDRFSAKTLKETVAEYGPTAEEARVVAQVQERLGWTVTASTGDANAEGLLARSLTEASASSALSPPAPFSAFACRVLPRESPPVQGTAWEADLSNRTCNGSVMSRDGEKLFVVDSQATVHGIHRATGEVFLRHRFGQSCFQKPALSPDEKTLYFAAGDYENVLYAFDLEKKETRWWVKLDRVGAFGKGSATSPLATRDGTTLIARGPNGHVYAFDAATGNQRWRHDAELTGVFVRTVPCESPDGKTVCVMDNPENRAFDVKTGALKWSSHHASGDASAHTAAFSPDGKRVLRPSRDELTAFDAESGEWLWSYPASIEGTQLPVFSRRGDFVVFLEKGRTLHIVNTKTGRERYEPIMAETGGLSAKPVVLSGDDRYAYALTNHAELVRYDLKDGTAKTLKTSSEEGKGACDFVLSHDARFLYSASKEWSKFVCDVIED